MLWPINGPRFNEKGRRIMRFVVICTAKNLHWEIARAWNACEKGKGK